MPALLKQWEKDVRERMEKDPNLKKLAAKYPLVLLHSHYLYGRWGCEQSSFSFNFESADPNIHGNRAQLQFNGPTNKIGFQKLADQQNLVVDLGVADFATDPDPRAITIDDPRILPSYGKAVEGHVYLERVRDAAGNDFYVVFQVVALEKERGRYLAFLWRKLPGGKVVKK
jgi:hypothetical protein